MNWIRKTSLQVGALIATAAGCESPQPPTSPAADENSMRQFLERDGWKYEGRSENLSDQHTSYNRIIGKWELRATIITTGSPDVRILLVSIMGPPSEDGLDGPLATARAVFAEISKTLWYELQEATKEAQESDKHQGTRTSEDGWRVTFMRQGRLTKDGDKRVAWVFQAEKLNSSAK